MVCLNQVKGESIPCKGQAQDNPKGDIPSAIANRDSYDCSSLEESLPQHKMPNTTNRDIVSSINSQIRRKNDKYLYRLVVAFIVSIIPFVILSLFVLSRCMGAQEISVLTEDTEDKALDVDTSSVFTNTSNGACTQPVPQWVKGVWTGEAQFFRITLEVGDAYITEINGNKKARGAYQYDNGRLYCRFPENSTYTYLVNEDTHTITAGEGLILRKQK